MDYIAWLRQFKIGSFALFDLSLSFVGMYLLAPLLSRLFRLFHLHLPRSTWVWWTIPISVIVHAGFGQSTPLMQQLAAPSGYWLEKIAVVVMTILGCLQIRKSKSRSS